MSDPKPDPQENDAEDEDHVWSKEEQADFDALARMPAPGGPDVSKVVSVVFFLVGAILVAVSGATEWYTRKSLAAEISVPGVVVRNELRQHATPRNSSSSSRGSSDLYHAVVEFELEDGTSKTVEMREGRWPKAHEEGDAVTVRYNAERPLDARIGGGGLMDYFGPILTGALGFLFMSLAVFIRWIFRAASQPA